MSKKNLYIPQQGNIISHLQKQNYSVSFIDEMLLKLFQEPKRGWIYLGKMEFNRLEFLKILGSSRGRYKIIKLIPGETTEIFLENMAKELELDSKKLKDAFYSKSRFKEAGILADSYNIPTSYSEQKAINYLLNITTKRYKSIAKEYGIEYGSKKWKEILVIASIIQKEAANKKEMPLVSSVIYNRLKKRMRLQMDGTLNYGKYSHIRVTPQRIKDDNSTYNTYKHRGLPKYPVCNVSTNAIISAIKPAKTDYLYFMKNSRGGHNFTKSYKKHIKNIRIRQKEQKDEKNKKSQK